MLQPRRNIVFVLLLFVLVDCLEGFEYDINETPRRKRQDEKDLTTVLLVDSRGRSSFGRFLSVKPDLGLITSTARTFIQEGVTTEYATQVLGTTLDNGRLYAHLLTKSSRVLYDDSPTKAHDLSSKKWNLNENLINPQQFIRNLDYISPNNVDSIQVFPTKLGYPQVPVDNNNFEETLSRPQEIIEEEILKESPSNNYRVPYGENHKNNEEVSAQNNVKVFKISPQIRDITNENIINHKETNDKPLFNDFAPSKVKPWENLPTFTVRNEFSPSGLSFLGDLPDFEEHTERAKLTTPTERKAKLLFRAGLAKPNSKDLTSITYSGFADFTTTVGDTVIIFSPHTTNEVQKPAGTTKISVEPTLIQPTTTLQEPPLATQIKTFLSREPPMETKTFKGPKLEMKTSLPTLVIDKTDRTREPKSGMLEEQVDMDAKSSVLAREQGQELESSKVSITFTSDLIQPSESKPSMLSTPSDEDIAKIFASLQALAKQSTEPLKSQSTISFDSPKENVSGATTIFFDDDLPIETTSITHSESTQSVEKISTTTERDISKYQITTEEVPENQHTTLKQETITEEEILTTSENIISTTPLEAIIPEDKEGENKLASVVCTGGSEVFPSTVYKTLTYLTTFFIPTDGTTTTSVKSNEVVSTEIISKTRLCDHVSLSPESETFEPNTEEITTLQETKATTPISDDISEEVTEEEAKSTPEVFETIPQEITTESRFVTESESESTDATTEDGDEVELIFKTLYTTYTYLTTYFQETTSSIASRIVVTTNVISSTLDPGKEATDDAVSGLFDNDRSLFSKYKSKTVTFEDVANIDPSNIETVLPTISYNSENLEDYQESVLAKPTPILDDNKLLQTANGVKTYYTTYTYFTTIFVDGETEISSRTEVYTNFVTPSLQTRPDENILPTNVASIGEGHTERQQQNDEDSIKQKISKLNIKAQNNYNTINRKKPSVSENESDNEIYATVDYKSVDNIPSSVKQATDYVTLERGASSTENEGDAETNPVNLSEYETIATMVTDVRSSTSEGDRRIIDNVDKRNVFADDQIVSESNNDSEIIPSPTLLLQTSYTTFTYFTTMYHGTTSSNVVSRLETITNVVTQTLTPTHTLSSEDLSLPVTYFTTFTYWTTLYKDGVTKITSREETVSNIETPSIEATELIQSSPTSVISATSVPIDVLPTASENIFPSSIGDDDLTTYFTTYTYYTTSYIGNNTVLNSRLETVTNVLNNTLISDNNIGRSIGSGDENKLDGDKSQIELPSVTSTIKPTGLLSTIVNTLDNDGITTILSTDVYGTYIDGLYAKVLESTSSILASEIKSSPVKSDNLHPTGVVSINKGKIVDAEGVSTLFYTTQAVGTYIDNLYAQVTESTSSLTVDEVKKAALPTNLPIAHKTGLVRLIEGSIIQNDTTTFYESKVLGTNIDGRYAQIIESTSSFLVGSQASLQPSNVNRDIIPSPTKAPEQILSTTETISPSPVAIEGSISDTTKGDDDEVSTEDDDDENDEKDTGTTKKRLTFQSRKRTSTPAIRPFASRQRPTFAPKRKLSGQSTAATITRSDFTPTVTAVLASKSNRYNGRRSSSGVNIIQPTASGSRRFSRPKSTSGFGSSGRRSSSTRIQPTIAGSSSRRGGFRSSSFGTSIRPSSLFGARPRIRPTLASGLIRSPSSNVVARTSSNVENDLTTIVTEEPTDVTDEDSETTLALQSTTEISSKRNQNPLLRFRRPPLGARATSNPRSTTAKTGKNIPKKFTTTTTTKPKTVYNRPSSLLNRPRPNALFPRRGLFTTTTNPPEVEEEEEVEEEDDIEDNEDLDEEGEPEEDTDYDSSSTNTQILNPPTAQTTEGSTNNIQIKPFFRRRVKRSTYSRFRRPSSTVSSTENLQEEHTEKPQKTSGRGRYSNKSRSAKTSQSTTASTTNKRPRISPSKSSQQRTQFTLRENDKKSNFKRPTTAGRSNRPTTPSRSKTPKLRNSHQTEASTNYRKSSSNNRQTSRTNNRGRNTQRQKYQNNDNNDSNNFVLPSFDGTITVTHQIPVEVTIPVVNGKITEYKNIVTAKPSTEILNPLQYSTSLNGFGREVKVLLSENTAIGNNGATIITQFVLNETPTTSIIFTPTYINRRKTSYSHLVPSTIYEVEQVVNTIQPALAAQAPLANILLSQLLLGGLQPQQNALLGLQQPGLVPGTPTTEFKTKTTTYVTTITRETSTVIPLTFRGKEIFTTIIDSSVSVFTATEFLTDTVVVTPTLGYQGSQLNTALLLPLLQQQLQQQQLQQQQQQLAPNILHPQQPANVFSFDQPEIQALYKEQEKLNLALEDSEELQETEEIILSSKRKSPRRGHKNKPAVVEPPKETSIITLYVSGRTPGEFTSILSTVTVGEGSARKRRDLQHVLVQPSLLPSGFIDKTSDTFDSLVMPTKESLLEVSEIEKETESLESIIGDVPKYMTTQTPELFNIKSTKASKSSKKYRIKYAESSKQDFSNFLA